MDIEQEKRTGSSSDNIKVLVRIRPLNSKEENEEATLCVRVDPESNKNIIMDSKPKDKTFGFDWVGDNFTQQEEVFKQAGSPLVDALLMGYNCTLFAYGQTGAGKTYTMQGKGLFDFNSNQDSHRGVQLRSLDLIFSRLRQQAAQKDFEFLIRCSYLEIYNEQIIDLLSSSSSTLQIREDFKRGIFVEGIIEEVASSPEEAVEVLKRGARNRHIGATQMNQESSRSHSIFTVVLETKSIKNGVTRTKSSKFNFVDLAGSERQKQTGTTGERFKEATNINKSLTVLGSVINSLVEITEGKKVHVRFRDSKLTFLLKDSLGGNAKTIMIASVSPASTNFLETLSTLKFAQRAKMIKNKASINEESSAGIEALKEEIRRLKEELSKSQAAFYNGVGTNGEIECKKDKEEKDARIKENTQKASEMDQRLSELFVLFHEGLGLIQDVRIEDFLKICSQETKASEELRGIINQEEYNEFLMEIEPKGAPPLGFSESILAQNELEEQIMESIFCFEALMRKINETASAFMEFQKETVHFFPEDIKKQKTQEIFEKMENSFRIKEESLKKEVSDLQERMKALREDLDYRKRVEEDLFMEKSALETANKNMREAIENRKVEVEQIEENKNKENESLNSVLKAMEIELEAIKRHSESQRIGLAEAASKLEEHQKEMRRLHEENSKRGCFIETLNEEKEIVSKELKAKTKESEQLNRLYKENKEESQRRLDELNAKLEEMSMDFKEKESRLLFELESQNEVLIEKKSLQEELDTVQKAQEFLIGEVKTKREASLAFKRDLENEKKARRDLEERLESMQGEMKDTSTKKSNENLHLKCQIAALQEENKEVLKEREELRCELASANTKLSSALPTLSFYQESFEQISKEMRQLRMKCNQLDEENRAKEAEIKEILADLQETNEENLRIQQETKKTKDSMRIIEKMLNETIEKNQKMERSLKENEELRMKKQILFSKEIQEERDKTIEWEKAYSNAKKELEESNRKHAKAQNEVEVAFEDLRGQNSSLKQQIDGLKQESIRLIQQVACLKEENERMITERSSFIGEAAESFKENLDSSNYSQLRMPVLINLENERSTHQPDLAHSRKAEEKHWRNSVFIQQTLKELESSEIQNVQLSKELIEKELMVQKIREDYDKGLRISIAKMSAIINQYHAVFGLFQQMKVMRLPSFGDFSLFIDSFSMK